MARVTHGHIQFICRYYAQVWMTILPPELVADRCNPDRVAGRRCFLNEGNHSCCRHEQCDDDENWNADYDIRQTFSGAIPCRLVAKRGPAMSVYSQKQVMRFCARRRSRSCMITLLVCGSMLTSVALGRGYSLEVDSLS